jgi:hypothetical protein
MSLNILSFRTRVARLRHNISFLSSSQSSTCDNMYHSAAVTLLLSESNSFLNRDHELSVERIICLVWGQIQPIETV